MKPRDLLVLPRIGEVMKQWPYSIIFRPWRSFAVYVLVGTVFNTLFQLRYKNITGTSIFSLVFQLFFSNVQSAVLQLLITLPTVIQLVLTQYAFYLIIRRIPGILPLFSTLIYCFLPGFINVAVGYCVYTVLSGGDSGVMTTTVPYLIEFNSVTLLIGLFAGIFLAKSLASARIENVRNGDS